ncbi:MAG TPA: hypothetical protein PK224_03920 [Nitrospira sp.]|nr:hypothetical protein [Nitrospira sp.]
MKTSQEMKEARYAAGIIKGLTKKQAAIEAGFSVSVAEHSVNKIHEKPAVQAAIEQARTEIRAAAVYDLTRAMRESLEVIEFAKQHKNAMAYFKAVEHRAKLSGLLIDRLDVKAVVVNVRAALEEARGRLQAWNGPRLEASQYVNPLSD